VLGDSGRVGRVLNNLATTYYYQSRLDPALTHWRAALRCARATGRQKGIATVLNNIAIVHTRRGAYEQALEAYQQSLTIERDLGDRLGVAEVLTNIGLLYERQGRYQAALRKHRASLEIERAENNPAGIAASLGNIGLILQNQGRYEEALARYRESLALQRELDDRPGVAAGLNNIGVIFKNQGRYDQALAAHRQSLAIKEKLGDRGGIAGSLSNIGTIKLQQGRLDDALHHFRRALAIEDDLQDQSGRAQTLSSIGTVRQKQGRLPQALDRYRASLALMRTLEDRSGRASLLYRIGTVRQQQEQYQHALSRLRAALSIQRETEETGRVAQTLAAIGDVHRRRGEDARALSRYRRALRLSRDVGTRPDVVDALQHIGALRLRNGALSAATDTLRRAVRLAEQVRSSATSPAARRSLLATQIASYRRLTAAHARAGRPAAALRSVEQARARLLSDQLRDASRADTTYAIPSAQELRRPLGPDQAALLYANASSAAPLLAIVVTRDTIRLRTLPDSTFEAGVRRQYAAQIEQLRRQNGPLVDAIGSASRGARSLAAPVRLYRHQLTRVSGRDSIQTDLARRFYDLLVAPIRPLVADKDALVVVPTGALGYLPFEVLRPEGGPYLVETAHIRYAQSLTTLRQLQQRDYPSSRHALLGVGGAVYNNRPQQAPPLVARVRGDTVTTPDHASALLQTAVRDLDKGRSPKQAYAALGYGEWTSLYGTKKEVRKIDRVIRGRTTLLTGRAATEARVREMSTSGALARYRRLHFATHGVAVPEAPRLSALVLSQVGTTDSLAVRDGYLTMSEIADLRLRADVAVLSACRSGLGRLVAGEGVVNLSHAFLQAGANATLVSQWRIVDWSTQQFMTAVYRTARDTDLTFAEATSAVKRDFIAGEHGKWNTNPRRWAPFVYYGRE
jgi:tetratricopeptide (TPR) repeat protein